MAQKKRERMKNQKDGGYAGMKYIETADRENVCLVNFDFKINQLLFQPEIEKMNKMRSEKEMTVADMISLTK